MMWKIYGIVLISAKFLRPETDRGDFVIVFSETLPLDIAVDVIHVFPVDVWIAGRELVAVLSELPFQCQADIPLAVPLFKLLSNHRFCSL